MKFEFFHLMPYPDLPDDFREKHHSVWVDPHSSLFDPVVANRATTSTSTSSSTLPTVGFDGICVNEHHQNAYGLMPSPNLMAAALARRTKNAALVVMGNSLALYNPPTRVAEEFAMLDCLSGGRLVAGFPVGTPMDTTFGYGQVPGDPARQVPEAHDLVMRAWQERGPVHLQRQVQPAPLRQHLAAAGSEASPAGLDPRRRQRSRRGSGAPETDYLYAYLSYFGYQRGMQVMKGSGTRSTASGVDRTRTTRASCSSSASPRRTSRRRSDYAEAADYFYNRCLHIAPRFRQPARLHRACGRSKAASAIEVQQARGLPAKSPALKWKDFVDRGYIVAGSPQRFASSWRKRPRTCASAT